MRIFVCISALLLTLTMRAQTEQPEDTSWKKLRRYTPEKINDLIHTKLDITPDYSKSYVYGKEWVTLTPHFYSTDTVRLDAKGMDIAKVSLLKASGGMASLTYEYDGFSINIKLDKTYRKGERYTLYIEYTAKPDEYESKYGGALLGIKGFYFINPRGEEKGKPVQIWTQGESESNSAWFPTIDHTNQKTTQELTVTVPSKYVTLSNGKLMTQKNNSNGTRTDYWKMDLPHSPYLFFLGVGEYAVIKDSWRGKEVSYYVEKEYAPVAKKIFGNTPEMMTFFSKMTGVDYPWNKYSQITGRDYVAGAMENTTATLHQEYAQQDARQLVDGNIWEGTIAHELFHHWFGDYVTAENWTNITLNESFADYSETLWFEYKYGKDEGDAENYNGMKKYLASPDDAKKDLVRFYYSTQEDVFDLVSYQKGGRVLNMLRNYLGDSAFFKGMNLYLTTYKFKAAEVPQLRLAFEEVSGKDLTWFFNQWYFGSGHPLLDINYTYDEASKKVTVKVKQTQTTGKIFRLPVKIDVYTGSSKTSHRVWVEEATNQFTFTSAAKPDLINFDGDKVLLCVKKENKTLDNYMHQYKFAGKYVDRREAIEFCSTQQNDPKAIAFLKTAVKDPSARLRNFTLDNLDVTKSSVGAEFESTLLDLAKNDKDATVRGKAIGLLGLYRKPEYKALFQKAINDSSYSVAGNALQAFYVLDSSAASKEAVRLDQSISKGKLEESINMIFALTGNEEAFEKVSTRFDALPLSDAKFDLMNSLVQYVATMKNPDKVKKGVDQIITFRDQIPEPVNAQTDPYFNGVILPGLIKKKTTEGLTDQANYIKSKLPKK
jgi:aminopeptidase N